MTLREEVPRLLRWIPNGPGRPHTWQNPPYCPRPDPRHHVPQPDWPGAANTLVTAWTIQAAADHAVELILRQLFLIKALAAATVPTTYATDRKVCVFLPAQP